MSFVECAASVICRITFKNISPELINQWKKKKETEIKKKLLAVYGRIYYRYLEKSFSTK